MKVIYYLIDLLAAIVFTLSETAMKSWVSFLLFLPLIAFLIPVFIWLDMKKRRGDKIDYTW